MFKGFQDTSALQQFHGFPNLNMQQATSAYGFSGVTFWLDAAYGLNTQTNLGAVSSWQQRVGGGTFVQATAASQPRLILNDANYNNLPSVESQDTARFMLANQGLFYQGGMTIAVVSKVNTANVLNTIISNPNIPDTNFSAYFLDGGTNAGFNGFLYSGGGVFMQGTTESTNTRIKILTNTNVIVNGAIQTTSNINSSSRHLMQIFRAFADTLGNLVGSIAEIIAFGYSMTSDEAIALSNNINQKYAIY